MGDSFNNNDFYYKQKYLKYKNKYIAKKIILNINNLNQRGGNKIQIVFTYQGAFAPPHLGHLNSANIFINELKKRYNLEDYAINFMFMPTCNLSSKSSISLAKSADNKSDYVSEESRKTMLDYYVEQLKAEHPDISISCSTIEFEICKGMWDDIIPNTTYRTATINTLSVLRNKYPKAILGLGIGIDNGFEISTWSMINLYVSEPVNLEFILMCDRKPSESVPPIDISKQHVIEKVIQISKTPIGDKNIEAFINSDLALGINKMYFKNKEGLDIPNFEILVNKMVVLDSPDEFSSSQVRNLIRIIYQIESVYKRDDSYKLVATNSVWSLVTNICGHEITRFIRENNIFNPK